jgi:hypothetical protein
MIVLERARVLEAHAPKRNRDGTASWRHDCANQQDVGVPEDPAAEQWREGRNDR